MESSNNRMKNSESNHDDNNSNKFVLPGEKVAVIEEYIPDDSCFETDGVIFSKIMGNVDVDQKQHKIRIIPRKVPITPKVGDICIGRVEFCKKQMAGVDIHFLNGKNMPIPISGTLHISEVSKRYVKTMFEVVRPGDWIRCKLIKTDPKIYISLVGKDLGVIVGYCIHCGTELEYYRRDLLSCPNCGFEQNRITSRTYGKHLNLVID